MKLIAAADKNWAIGKDGGLLCHLPGDMKFFREKTTGKTVVMGRKTLESFPGGKPLPKRTNVVLTKSLDFDAEGCEVVHSIPELIEKYGDDDVFVIGGGTVYEQLIELCDVCYITRINAEFQGDTYMPNLDELRDFELFCQGEPILENGMEYRFTEYRRKKRPVRYEKRNAREYNFWT